MRQRMEPSGARATADNELPGQEARAPQRERGKGQREWQGESQGREHPTRTRSTRAGAGKGEHRGKEQERKGATPSCPARAEREQKCLTDVEERAASQGRRQEHGEGATQRGHEQRDAEGERSSASESNVVKRQGRAPSQENFARGAIAPRGRPQAEFVEGRRVPPQHQDIRAKRI